MSKKTLITSALLYANGHLHIGHLVEYIQTDIYVRFLKLIGEDVIYCCADDTHGAPISIKAEKEGIRPEELIEKMYGEHVEDFKAFGVQFDSYYTTHSDENRHFSDRFFKIAKEKGFIYKKDVSQLYCPKDKRFLPDRYVKGECPKCHAQDQYGDVCESCGSTHKPIELIGPKCSICGTTPEMRTSEHYFFRLSAFSDRLNSWLSSNQDLQPEIVNSVRQWIKEGLADWDISRDSPYFGFKIPGEDDLYYYVWWDAPIGYLASAEHLLKQKGDNAESYWSQGKVMHFIGKDIIYFHFLFWPAVLMAVGYNTPASIVVHGFLTVGGEKMSKSRGTFFTAKEFAARYEPEHLRFYYAGMLSKKMSDLNLDFDDFEKRINNELAANIGNFCNRTITFTNKSFDSKIGDIEEDKAVIQEVKTRTGAIKAAYQDVNLKEAVKEMLAISSLGNRYMQERQPWQLMKSDRDAAQRVLGTCVNIAKDLAILIKPIMPKLAVSLESQLNLRDLTWEHLGFNLKDHTIGKAEVLVKRIEKKKQIEMPFDLKVAEILSAEPHPDAEKLVVLKLNAGEGLRQIVAGVRQHYKPEELTGKRIIVVTNLKPAKLRGIESNGMLLAAEHEGVIKVIFVDAPIGEQVTMKDSVVKRDQITIDQFMKLNKLSVSGKSLKYEGQDLLVAANSIPIDMPDGSRVR
jgi:methionyl-tRNA synthetase